MVPVFEGGCRWWFPVFEGGCGWWFPVVEGGGRWWLPLTVGSAPWGSGGRPGGIVGGGPTWPRPGDGPDLSAPSSGAIYGGRSPVAPQFEPPRADPIRVGDVEARLVALRARIAAAGRNPDEVTIMAVTKAFGPDAADAALALGLETLGENYVQEMVAKVPLVRVPTGVRPEWHFIGRLQRNKVRHLVGLVDVIETLDRASLAREIARRMPAQRVFVQVNISGEAQKGGCAVADTTALVEEARGLGLRVEGLMGVAAAGDLDRARNQFRTLRELADDLALEQRSMGMTADLEAALAEGSTIIRVGSALFGPRPPRNPG